MEKFTFSQAILEAEENVGPIADIEQHIGRSLIAGETLEFESGLCNGVQCAEGYVCILGNCVKDDAPTDPSDNG